MILKNNYEKIELKTNKIIFTNNLFELWRSIITNNDKLIIISPLTKVSELYEIKNNSPFYQFLMPYLDQKLVNIEYLQNVCDQINRELLINTEANDQNSKVLKSFIEISDQYVTPEIIIAYLTRILPLLGGKAILIIGFEAQMHQFIEASNNYNQLFCLTNDLAKAQLPVPYLDLLIIDVQHKRFFEVQSFNELHSFLEFELNTEISTKQVINFLANGRNDPVLSQIWKKI